MKFGRNLPRNQVPEWASQYIRYKGLKKLIKSAAEAVKHGDTPDTAEFFYFLDRNLEDVDGFYNKKYGDAARRLRLLQDRYGETITNCSGMNQDEVQELMQVLTELRAQLRNLKWYGEVNRRGFIKITKKLDKKVPNASTQRRYLESKVDPKQFATNTLLQESMKTVNDSLSSLGEIKFQDDRSSAGSLHSLRRSTSRISLHLSQEADDAADQALRNDDVSGLNELLAQSRSNDETNSDTSYAALCLNLLQRAISCKARHCVDALLGQIETLDEEHDINKRNCIHRLIISIGRSKAPKSCTETAEPDQDEMYGDTNYIRPAAVPTLAPHSSYGKEVDGVTSSGRPDSSVLVVQYVLDKLRPKQRPGLQARDLYGRLPLHYAAQHGLVVICQILLDCMRAWSLLNVEDEGDALSWQDTDGYTPLHLSALGGHPLTTEALLNAGHDEGSQGCHVKDQARNTRSSEVLALATKKNYIEIVKLLVAADIDLDYQDDQGETALHVAARFGHIECARALLEGTKHQRANLELAENTFGWTPLFVACVDGQLGIVEHLISAGADADHLDTSGWTAKEHASLRGHIDIANALAQVTASSCSEADACNSMSTTPSAASFAERKSNGLQNGNGTLKTTEVVKTFGHRYLSKESMVLVSLGTMDMRRPTEAVKLNRIPMTDAHSTQLDTALSLVVSARGANGEPSITDLPVQDNVNTEPIVFTTPDATKVQLIFDIVPTYAGSHEQRVGRGVALLASIKPSIGSKRISLQGDLTVPIVAADTLEVIGSVQFNFLIITPFSHPNMGISADQTYWKSMASTMVIGHRGLGKNFATRRSLQLGENTIQSFIAAASLGASYVEFDVQLTKDHVPVIYHDFLVSETGIDAPVHILTLEQFLHVNHTRTPRVSPPASPTANGQTQPVKVGDPRRNRSMSEGNAMQGLQADSSERMKHTRDYKEKGYKANSRGNFIQEGFTTLEEMFKKLPEHIGFNIEMKYPMLHESEEQEMDTYAVELNSFVDTVLTKVYDLGGHRNIIFSSFHPDICLLLSFKQPSIPIFFLTDAGTSPVGDIRASSLQEAIRFASRWNLLGIVTAAEPLVLSPRLVRVVKESGLVCVSYGVLNNEAEKVKLQVREGIDAVIVDNVLAIRQGLTGAEGVGGKAEKAEGMS